MTLNITELHSDRGFFKATCGLYRKSLFATLPISVIGVLLFDTFLRLQYWLPILQKSILTPFGIMGALLCLPLIPTIWLIQTATIENQAVTTGTFLLMSYQRILALLGCLVSLLLIPAIAFGILLVTYLVIWQWMVMKGYQAELQWLFSPICFFVIKVLVGFILLATVNTKSLAPLLLFKDNLDPDPAMDKSETLIAHHNIKTYLFNLFGILILVFAYQLPQLILSFCPTLSVPHWAPVIASDLLVGILLPWTLSLWLMQLIRYDQQPSS